MADFPHDARPVPPSTGVRLREVNGRRGPGLGMSRVGCPARRERGPAAVTGGLSFTDPSLVEVRQGRPHRLEQNVDLVLITRRNAPVQLCLAGFPLVPASTTVNLP